MGAKRSCSTSRSCGFLGGSWGSDIAGGSWESTRTFCSVERLSVENAMVNLGNVQIYQVLAVNNEAMNVTHLHDPLRTHQ